MNLNPYQETQRPVYFSRNGLSEIVLDEGLGFEDFYIFFSIAKGAEPSGWVFLSEDLYDSIDFDSDVVDEGIERLVARGYLTEGPEAGGGRMLRISPTVVVDEIPKRAKLRPVGGRE